MSATVENLVWQKDRLTRLKDSYSLLQDDALQIHQENALQAFLSQDFPTRKTEDWKYTPLSALSNQAFTMSRAAKTAVALEKINLEAVYRVVFIDGELQAQQSTLTSLPRGIHITPLSQQLTNKRWHDFLNIDERYQTMFSQLNLGLLTEGLFIQIEKGVVLDKPLHILYQHSANAKLQMHHPRHVILAEEESALTVIEEYSGSEVEYFTNAVTEIFAGVASNVQHFKIQRESLLATHIANTIITQQRDSSVISYVFSLGAKLARENLNFACKASGTSCHLYGIYLPLRDQHVDHHTRVDHLFPNCFSQQLYKGVIAAKGRAVFNGKVIVHPDAQKTAAHQNNQNLLLSENAEVNTKPELEIYADDVKCSHGATVGQIDEAVLFYLRSRGIDLATARKLLIHAFAGEIVETMPANELRSYIHQLIKERLENCHE